MTQPASRRRFAATSAGSILVAGAPLLLAGCGWGPKFRVSEDDSFLGAADCRVLLIENDVGDIQVLADPDAYEIRAEVVKTGLGRSMTQAEDALHEIDIEFSPDPRDGSVFNAIVHHPKRRHGKAYEVDWTITAPPHLTIQLTNDVGDVDVDGFQEGVEIKNDVGDVVVYGSSGGLTITNDVGDVTAEGSGEIWVRTDVGDVVVEVLEVTNADITARSDVGDAVVYLPRGWEGEITAETDVGGVSVRPGGEPLRIYRDRRGIFNGVMGDAEHAHLNVRTDVGSARVRVERGSERESDEVVSTERPATKAY